MKNLKGVLLSLLLASLASAQSVDETYSIPVLAVTVAEIDLGRNQHNEDRCVASGYPTGVCTQAEVCVAQNVAGGASCTAMAAILAGQRIYPDSQAGRNAFIGNELVRSQGKVFVQKQKHLDLNKARAFCAAATQIQLDAICSAFGLGAGCFVCPLQ